MTTDTTGPARGLRVLVIDDDEQMGAAPAALLEAWGSRALRLTLPDDGAVRDALNGGHDDVDVVAVVTRDDIVALRYALLVEHVRPGVRLAVTIFDRTTAEEITRSVPNCSAISLTDAIVPNLLAACLDARYRSVVHRDGQLLGATESGDLVPVPVPARLRRWSFGVAPARGLDTSARALVLSTIGLLASTLAEALLGVLVLHEHVEDAVWHAARILTTVGSSPAAEHGPAWYKIVSTLLMVVTLAWVGLFTAGLVDRVTGRKLTALVGRRALPRRGHVIVVGVGQVGLRLCVRLRELGVPVVGVERDEHARWLPVAQAERIPVVVGRGGDRFLLRRVGVEAARAVAAVTSDPVENVSIAVTARAAAPDGRIVLRAGGLNDVVDECRSLFRIGAVCDVQAIISAQLACHVVGVLPDTVFTSSTGTVHAAVDGVVVDLDRWDTAPSGQPDDGTAPA